MTTERARVVVVGGGVIGCAVLREFARRRIPGILLEAEPDIGEGASKANSAILHTGFDSKPGTIESTMLRRAASLWPTAVEELNVPFLPLGALMLAHTTDEARRLTTEIAANATALGVSTEFLDRDAVRDVAPYLADDVIAALSIPDEGVLDPFWLTRAYADAAISGGAEVRLGQEVIGLGLSADAVTVQLADGSTIEAEQVVNAAGMRADDVAGLIGDTSFGITPRKGQFLVSEEAFGVDRIVLPIPGPYGKGMLVTPIVFGGLLLGPTAVEATDKDDRSTDPGRGLADPWRHVRRWSRRSWTRCPCASSWAFGRSAPLAISSFALRRSPTGSTSRPAFVQPGYRLRRLSRRRWSTRSWLAAVGRRPRLRGLCCPHRSTYPRRPARSSVSADRSAGVRSKRPAANRPNHARSTRSSAEAGPCSAIVKAISAVLMLRGSSLLSVPSPCRPLRSTVAAPGSGRRSPIPPPANAQREPSEMPGNTDVLVIGLGGAGRAAADRRRPKRARPSSELTGVPAPPWSACR